MKIGEITAYIESLAPLSSQESYDNSGLIVGNTNWQLTNALICIDSTEEIVREAIQNNCNLIIAHHPIVFSALKKITGKNYVERVVIECIKNDIALYAAHTNFDNFKFGVNYEIGQRLGLTNLQILDPKDNNLFKITVFVPQEHREFVARAMFEVGAGTIGNYHSCGFYVQGNGTFTPTSDANPYIGSVDKAETVSESRLEMIVQAHLVATVIQAMKNSHPYEEVAYDLVSLHNKNSELGAGMIGKLPQPMKTTEWLRLVKKQFNCGIIRHTKIHKDTIEKIAFCGGSGAFLLPKAIQQKADVYLSGDFKYHEFFDAENHLMIADIGHFESEQYTINRLHDLLTKKFANFAPRLTEVNTNPINYF